MKKKQLSQISYYSRLMKLMEENLDIWKDLNAMRSGYDAFVHNFKKLEDLASSGSENLQVYTSSYIEKRGILMQELQPFLNSVAVYAYDSKNVKLENLASIKSGKLESLKDKDLFNRIEKILKMLKLEKSKGKKAKMPEQVAYGINEDLLSAVHESIDSLKESLNALKESQTEKRKRQAEGKKLIKANNILLTKKIDRLVYVYQKSNPDFVEAYFKVRTIEEKEVELAKPSSASKESTKTSTEAEKKTTASARTTKAATTKSVRKTTRTNSRGDSKTDSNGNA